MSTVPRATFFDSFLNAVVNGRSALFIGAGLSVPAGYVDWRQLLRPLAEDIELDIGREQDLLRVVQYAINQAGGRARVNSHLIEEFNRDLKPTKNHQLLAQLPVPMFWTTNYDSLIEDSLRDAGRTVSVNHSQEQLTSQSSSANAVVYKMHGDKAHPNQCVLSYDDYERFMDTRGQFVELLRGALVERTFLFLGYSLSDPNIDHILSRLKVRFGPDRREHFWVTKRPVPSDFTDPDEYNYVRGRDELRTRDLQRYGIQTVSIEEYSQVTSLLEDLLVQYRRRFIFISGAAHDFEPLGQSSLESLVRAIGVRLAEQDYILISGGGLGVGTAAVLGAVSYATTHGTTINDRIRVTAFDQGIENNAERNRIYREYRERMLNQAGFAIFVSGNKLAGDVVTTADGVREEFEIAVRRDAVPIPVGATGYLAEEIWREVRNDHKRYYQNAKVVNALDRIGPGVTDIQTILDGIFDIIHMHDGRRR